MVQTDGLSRKCHLFKHDVSFCFTFNEKCIFCCLLRYSKLKERKNMHPFKYYVFYNALLFLHLKSIHGYRQRHELFHHSFKFSGASVWNSLPVNIQNASNVKQFKRLYLRWFRNNVYLLFQCRLPNRISAIWFVLPIPRTI